jgi:hypothetical protein
VFVFLCFSLSVSLSLFLFLSFSVSVSLYLFIFLCFFCSYSQYYFRAKVIGTEVEQKAARALKEKSDIISLSLSLSVSFADILDIILGQKSTKPRVNKSPLEP